MTAAQFEHGEMASGPQTLSIFVPRKPVSVNQAYCRAKFSASRGAGGGKGLVLTKAGREFKDAVRSHALAAKLRQGWPPPERVREVALTITTFNTRHDADSAVKLTADALQGVIYPNDRVVSRITAQKGSDAGKARVEICVELLRAV